ncbi:MAG: hypothetical protein ACK6C7_08050 [Pseudanabaena sp.]
MAELRSAIFWVLCPKQSLHCYIWSFLWWEGSTRLQRFFRDFEVDYESIALMVVKVMKIPEP